MRDGQGSQRFVAEAAVTVWAFLVGSSGRTQTPEGSSVTWGLRHPTVLHGFPKGSSVVFDYMLAYN